ncbi:MAG: SET domain-containing protein [Mesorhizobium sp.]|uniref:hypothetical protein n=1 Tax=Mesorhizobium sp. TaxID=1871066 RepID=UPI00121DE87F|nr:hypothetical protein [Mesorhizobium sp.]TIL84246.1 MAG: SET domain-containing protein [Mesorhizobium sp.]TIR27928.1 MAG: SET domain-containing protein [Mesorhizobium sp.]
MPEEIFPPAPKWTPGVGKMQCSIDPTGHGPFAIRSVRKGEIIGRFGGRLISADSIVAYVAKVGKFGQQVHPRWYVCPENADEISRIGAINRSSEPNVGLSDALTLVAMEHIVASEEEPVELLMVTQ